MSWCIFSKSLFLWVLRQASSYPCQPRHEASVPSCPCQFLLSLSWPLFPLALASLLLPLLVCPCVCSGPPPLPLMFCLKAVSKSIYFVGPDEALIIVCREGNFVHGFGEDFMFMTPNDIHCSQSTPQHLQLFKAVKFDCSKSDYSMP